MPIYEYLCTKCKHETEILQNFHEEPKRVCPKCGGELKKLISKNAFHLKGDGWFKDGYGAKKKKESEKKESQPAQKETDKPKIPLHKPNVGG